MKSVLAFIRQHWFMLSFSLVMLIAIGFRFYDYSSRWGLGYDQAHDTIIARYAVEHFKLPLLGPFSSAGPFQTGGEWYWLIMLGVIFFPFLLNGPWIFLSIVQTLFVAGVILVAAEMVDKKFGLIAGLLAALSPAQISQSINLTNQAPIAFLSLGSIWAMFRLVKTKKPLYGFLLGLFVGIAISIHMEGASLVLLILLTILIGRPSILTIVYIGVGLLLPLLPIVIAEASHGFFNTKGMLQYYLHDQYRVPLEMLGRRWLTYLGILWPNEIATIIGGVSILGYVGFLMTAGAAFLLAKTKQLSKPWVILSLCFFGFILALRYVHTPLFDSYFMFAHPFIFLLLGMTFYILFHNRVTRWSALFLFILFLAGSFYLNTQAIVKGTNWTELRVTAWEAALAKSYPGQKFDIYDYQYRSSSYSFPLMLSLQYDHLLQQNGHRIALGRPSVSEDSVKHDWYPLVKYNTGGFDLLDVQSSSSAQLVNAHWTRISPQSVYNATELWYIKK